MQLSRALREIGMDRETYKLPDDVAIIHCGDLIHKGPFSDNIIEMVDNIMTANPGRWIQLLGNHEMQYFQGAPFFWGETISKDSQLTLAKWAQEHKVHIAYGIPTFKAIENIERSAKPKIPVPNKPILFTHAGLSYGFWKEFGFETDVVKLAEAINNAPIKVVSRPGLMLGATKFIKGSPAPTWAHVVEEVWDTWRSHELPFILVHGHTNAYNFEFNRWWPSPKEFRETTKMNPDTRSATTQVGNSLQIAIDPGYSKLATQEIQPSLRVLV